MPANDRQPHDDRTSLRDAGLRRMRSASRWLAGGAVVLTGAFAGLAATSAKHGSTATSGTAAPAQQVQPSSDDGAEHDDGGAQLQAPAQAPQQAPSGAQPQSSSGAS